MTPPRLHPLEDQRLADIFALQIVGSEEERAFDEITKLAARICGTPIAAISIVDSDRQTFKARIGIAPMTIPRDLSFCAHAILNDQVMVVEDASKDPRFADNAYVQGPESLRFYAGAPVQSSNGLPIGTVHVLDTVPRTLTEGQIDALKTLSNQVTQLLELKLKVFKLEEEMNQRAIKTAALEHLTEGVVVRDTNGNVVEFNSSALTILGLSAEEMRSMSLWDSSWNLVYEDNCHISSENFPVAVCLRTGELISPTIIGLNRRSSDLCWLKVSCVPLFLNKGRAPSHVVTTFEDVTRQRFLDEQETALHQQLSEAARLSLLGEMAGGIAHEINNPLAILSGRINKLQTTVAGGPVEAEKLTEEFSKLEKSVERIAKIVRGLKLYARDGGSDSFVTMDLAKIAEETLALCSERFRLNSVMLKFVAEPGILVECRPSQISQILMNLLSNAFDAISSASDKWVEMRVATLNGNAVVTVTDCGTGIDGETVKKMMRPFFTTKEVGKGTGLGLSISSGLAEIHGGRLAYVESSQNTAFALTLPVSRAAKELQVG